jgi:hypothetical protein
MWAQMQLLNRIRHQELLEMAEENRRGLDTDPKEDQSGDQADPQETKSHICRSGQSLELLGTDGEATTGARGASVVQTSDVA